MRKNLTPEEQKIKTAIKEAKGSILVSLGECIKKFRKSMGYSQENLASDINKTNIISDAYVILYPGEPALGIDFSEKMISRYENAASEMGVIAFINVCRGLRITPNELLKDFIPDIEFEQPEILSLYEQLDDDNKHLAIRYLDFLLFEQGSRHKNIQ